MQRKKELFRITDFPNSQDIFTLMIKKFLQCTLYYSTTVAVLLELFVLPVWKHLHLQYSIYPPPHLNTVMTTCCLGIYQDKLYYQYGIIYTLHIYSLLSMNSRQALFVGYLAIVCTHCTVCNRPALSETERGQQKFPFFLPKV